MATVCAAFLLSGCGAGVSVGSNGAPPVSVVAHKPGENDVLVDNGQKGESVRVGLISWRDLPFQTVKHQAYDYSCGSAAVATLMTYAYGEPTSEESVFKEMFARGNQEKIRRQGFSMLDMSQYLNAHGLNAQGFKITEDAIENYKLPVIALVNNKGYNHFVVVKAIDNGLVLVGDPNLGSVEYTKEAFSHMWNGIALIVTNKATQAHMAYNDKEQWRYVRSHAPLRDGNDEGIQEAALAPMSWQVARTMSDMLPIAMVGSSSGGGL